LRKKNPKQNPPDKTKPKKKKTPKKPKKTEQEWGKWL